MTAVRPERREAQQEPGETPEHGVPRVDDTMRLRAVSASPGPATAGAEDTMQLRTVSPPATAPTAAPTETRPPEAPAAGAEDTMQLRTVSPRVTAPSAEPPVPAASDPSSEPTEGSEDTMQLRLPTPPPTAAPVPEAPLGGRAERRRAARAQTRGRGRRGAAPEQSAAGRHGRRAPVSRGREPVSVKIVRAAGELCVTLGVVLLLFVSYQLWWTNVRAHEAADGTANRLEKQWDQGNAGGSRDPDDPRDPGAFAPGQGFAILWIPKLDVKAPIAEGTDKHSVLDKGMVGHYSGALETAMPWDKTGNFALAAHRNTHGEPFRYINKLAVGDKVVVETAQAYYTYAITSALPQTSKYNISVIQPVPVGSGFTRPGRYITLTTCTPEFTSTYRLIVWGKMVDVRPRSKGKPDALLGS